MKSLIIAIAIFTSISLWAQKDGDYHLDKEFNLSASGTIELSSSDAKVSITGSDRKTVHLKVDRIVTTKGLFFGSDEFALEIDNSGGNLRIRERSSSSSHGIVGYYREEYEIVIEAPMGASLAIKGDDGDYTIRNINGSIAMGVDDGDIDLMECKGNNFKFRLDDGNLNMDQGRGSIEIDTDDGDVRIRNANFTSIIATIDDGDFIVETSLANSGKYDIRAQDGLVSMIITGGGGEFNVRHDDARVIAEGGFDVHEKSESFTSLNLPNGTAKVDIRADDARIRLTKPN
ncbi:MAG TPA: DUF4097 family beta strand repeat-containing protein [Cyclobacteriaceae bacterium]